jgi:hypothetical protein
MAVTLAKSPQLLAFLAVVSGTGTGTDNAQVHCLLLTREDGYDDQVDYMHLQARAVEGGELAFVVAGDRSAAYAAARQGDSSEELMSQWIEQECRTHGL